MKILIVSDTYYPKVDGTVRFIEQFTQWTQHQWDLLVPQYKKHKNRNTTYVKPSRFFKIADYPLVLPTPLNLWRIIKAVRKHDVLFIQGPGPLNFITTIIGKIFRKRVISYLHTIPWEFIEKFFPALVDKFIYTLAMRFSVLLFNRCDLLLVPYAELMLSLEKKGVSTPMREAKLGIDIKRFSSKDKTSSRIKLKLPEEAFIIGYVGRISIEKNIDTLFSAFKKIPNAHLLLVGDGPLAKKYKSHPRVHISGFVKDVPLYLNAMDVFVMPSLTETTSLATLEAMACSLPVISTKVGYIPHYLTRDINGMFFPKDAISILYLKLEKLRNNKDLQKKLGKAARQTVEAHFPLSKSLEKIDELLKYTP